MPLNPAPVQQPVVGQNGIATQWWWLWFQLVAGKIGFLNEDGSYSPPSLADADAADNSIYYSTDQSKLVYKDAGGTVNDLY